MSGKVQLICVNCCDDKLKIEKYYKVCSTNGHYTSQYPSTDVLLSLKSILGVIVKSSDLAEYVVCGRPDDFNVSVNTLSCPEDLKRS